MSYYDCTCESEQKYQILQANFNVCVHKTETVYKFLSKDIVKFNCRYQKLHASTLFLMTRVAGFEIRMKQTNRQKDRHTKRLP